MLLPKHSNSILKKFSLVIMCTLTSNILTNVLDEQEVGYDFSILEHKYRPHRDSRRRSHILVVSGVNTKFEYSIRQHRRFYHTSPTKRQRAANARGAGNMGDLAAGGGRNMGRYGGISRISKKGNKSKPIQNRPKKG